MRVHGLLAATLVLLLPLGCTTDNPAYNAPEQICDEGSSLARQQFDLANPDQVDILFVVDNSSGMQPIQAAVAEAVPAFVDALEDEGLDWQIGVTSTDMADDTQRGALLVGGGGVAGCGDQPALVTSDTPDPGAAVACNVQLGANGSDIEQGLEATRQALRTDAAGPNPDFIRRHSRVVVIVVSDEDDCSAEAGLDRTQPNNCVWQQGELKPLEEYIGLLRSNAPRLEDGEPVALAGQALSFVAISGPAGTAPVSAPNAPEPACSGLTDAFSGNRYQTVVDGLGANGFMYNVCAPDYSDILMDVFDHAVVAEEDQLCLAAASVGSPRDVELVDRLGEAATPTVELGADTDYLYVGPTSACENGVVSIAADAHRDEDTHITQVWFCRQ